MRIIKFIIFLFSFGVTSFAIAAEVPIEDLSQNSSQSPFSPMQQSLSLDQRMLRIEHQIKNITDMNLPAKLDDLQQQIQQLRGELDVQQHSLKLLNDQLRNFYQDLDQRIKQAKALSPNSNDNGSTNKPATPNTFFNKEHQAYKSAFDLLIAKKYDAANTRMNAYLNDYPNGKYAVNAHYWLGEINYLQKKLQKAITEFQTVMNKYPTSAKVPDAMLKLAMIHNEQGEYTKAYQEFQQIKKKYPNSAAAQLVTNNLKKKHKNNQK